METAPLAIDDLTQLVIGCSLTVHSTLGPGLLESVYRDCLVIELKLRGVPVEVEVRVPIVYRGHRVKSDLKIDLRVDGRVVVEAKAVERIHSVHLAQVITYLKLTGCPAGLLINFNAASIRAGLRRLDHPDIYTAKQTAKKSKPGNS